MELHSVDAGSQGTCVDGYMGRLLGTEGLRKPDAIFRRGDQSNTFISDKNTDIYNEADARTKEALAKAADGY